MRIAVVGSGIAGLGTAWLLSRSHEVVLFEARDRLGGHTHTHDCHQAGRDYRVDSGFIVFNPHNYPLLTRMFERLGVGSRPTTMSFAVHDQRSGLEYNATRLATMFCQKRNLVSPRFWRMITDILRFYREAPKLLAQPGQGPSLGDYLLENRYSQLFIDNHLVPMASALWSSPGTQIMRFPARYLAAFMDNHRMLQVEGRPEWRVVEGGSSSYVAALQAQWSVQVRLSSPVTSVRRGDASVQVGTARGTEDFDQVVLACHADEALALLADADQREREVLGAFDFQSNDTVLHTDRSLLPRDPRAWAAWNAFVPAGDGEACTVSYCMNLLQSLQSPEPFVVTLNRSAAIDPDKVIARMDYRHPVYTHASVAAQARRAEINGRRRTWFAGAWWGFGFHEDGLRSGVEVARALGAEGP